MASLRIYSAGGCGINIASSFLKHQGKKTEGFAEIQTFMLDTSRSNLPEGVDPSSFYAVEGLDGSGKKRDSNYSVISERGREMLHTFKPGDINVVIHSASGGSGSIIGPILVSEMLSRDIPVIVIMVGSTDSRIEVHNTLNTLKTYEVISQKRGIPVPAVYYENTDDTPRGTVDARIHATVAVLSSVFSGENRELDSADLKNFLNYTNVTSFKPALTFLDFFVEKITVGKDQSVASLVTLIDESTNSRPDVHVEYQSVGFINKKAHQAINLNLPIHLAMISGAFHDILKRLETRLKVIDEAKSARVEKSILTSHVDSTDEGIVFDS